MIDVLNLKFINCIMSKYILTNNIFIIVILLIIVLLEIYFQQKYTCPHESYNNLVPICFPPRLHRSLFYFYFVMLIDD